MATLIAEKALASTKTAIPVATKASHVPRPIGCALPSTAATLSPPNAAIPTRFRRCIARVGMIQSGRAVCRDGAFCDRRVPVLDHFANADEQLLLGAATWLILIASCASLGREDRARALLVV